MARLTITALDTLFFRDGKPFSKGEETWADGIFPPAPSVLYGAVSTWYIEQQKLLGTTLPFDQLIQKSKGIRIQRLFLNVNGKGDYLPLPLDLLLTESATNDKLHITKMERVALPEASNLNNDANGIEQILKLVPRPEGKPVSDGLIPLNLIKFYQERDYSDPIRLKPYIKGEPKVGIALSKTLRSTDDGNLYRVGMQRPRGLDIVLEVEFPDLVPTSSEEYLIKLGGEGRFAQMRIDPDSGSPKTKPPTLKGEGLFKLYLSTPAIFKDGWKPDISQLGFPSDTKLITAAIGRPQLIGGFDMQLHKPKPMRRAVPAGSVYYYQTASVAAAQEAINAIHGCAISSDTFDQKQGFGIAYISLI